MVDLFLPKKRSTKNAATSAKAVCVSCISQREDVSPHDAAYQTMMLTATLEDYSLDE
jgi:hypothetical protein